MHKHDIIYQTSLIAQKSNMNKKYGCVITHRNKIISTGFNFNNAHNNNLSSNIYEPYKYSTHAEQDAISKIKNKNILNRCKIYIIKLDKLNNVKSAIPCPVCYKLLNKYKITKIISI
jgi:deoxycytidylate deaminase